MGWFDFLKKKKKEPQASQDNETPANQGNEAGSPPRSDAGLRLNQDAAVSLQKEITLLQVLDMIYDSPLRLVMQKRGQAEVLKILGTFLDSRPPTKEFWSQPGKEIVPAISGLFHECDQFAIHHGFKQSPQNLSMIFNIAIIGGVAAIMIPIFIIAPGSAQYFLFVLICVLCFLPNLVKRWVNTRVMKFQEANASDFVREYSGLLEIIHDMAQYLITDIREALVNAGNDVSMIRFRLWNSDYKDIKVLDAKLVPGMSKSMYDVRFLKDGEDANAPEVPGDLNPDVDFDIEPISEDSQPRESDDDASDIDDDSKEEE